MTQLQRIVNTHFNKLYGNNKIPTYLTNYKIFISIVDAQLESRRTGVEYKWTITINLIKYLEADILGELDEDRC